MAVLCPSNLYIWLEPFLHTIRANTAITGLNTAKRAHKVAACADDLIFLFFI